MSDMRSQDGERRARALGPVRRPLRRPGRRAASAAAAAMIALSGCASSDSGSYSSRDVGQVIETSRGRVVSSRPVDIASSEQSGLGAATGGVVGGIAGSTVGKGKGSDLATAAGILIGVGLGYLLERQLRSGEGVEYMVEMDDGRMVTIVQNQSASDAPIAEGQEVLVQYGPEYTRITPVEAGASGTRTASGAAGYPSDYPAPSSTSGGSGAYPSSYPPSGYPPSDYPRSDPASAPSGGVASGGAPAGSTVRPGDSEWRNPDLDSGGPIASAEPSGTYEPDPGGGPIYLPGPSSTN